MTVDQIIQLKKKFSDKEYPETLIDQAFQHYLKGKPPKVSHEPENHSVKFTTIFHFQFKKMEKILANHWSILLQDPLLKPFIPERPRVTYRRAPNLESKIALSKIRSRCIFPEKPVLIPLVRMYKCCKSLCKTCKYVKHSQKYFATKGKTYLLTDFYNCSSDFVVYGLTCP